EDNRAAQNIDRYVLAGAGEETWAPAFRGQGFRYLEVTAPSSVELLGLGADVLSTDCRPVGSFTCSEPLLVRIWGNVRRGHRAFKRSVPMEPDRDERQGWLGDPAKHAESDGYSFRVAAFYRKWLDDILLEQRPDGQLPEMAPAYWEAYDTDLLWPSLAPLLAAWLYDCYADLALIRRVYPALVRWLAFVDTLRLPDGTWDCHYGDWCDTSTIGFTTQRPIGATPLRLVATAYMAHNIRLVARFAALVGDEAAAAVFRARADEVRDVFQRTFYDQASGVYGTGTQTAYVLPLAFGLVPAQERERVVRNLARQIVEGDDGHLSVGLIGAQWLMQVLSRVGRADLALRIASQRTRPGWGYMVEQGATTVWERWDSDTQGPGMN
ncbi:MAG: family 78 glycoside hydrolase catalytic domain, partial [Pseudonocardiaceae bacterium]